MPIDNARLALVGIDNDGDVKSVIDSGMSDPWGRDVIISVFPKNGSVYGWDFSGYLTGRQIRQPGYAARVDATASDHADPTDRQTVQVTGSYLVKLDCGYWGHYYRDRPGQRDFGLIEGPDVWLCSYRGTAGGSTPANLLPNPGTKARALLDQLAANGRQALLLRHATIQPNADAAVPSSDTLYVCFPDLHLPEQWPELYPAATRLPPGAPRAALRRLLRQAQCKLNGLLTFSYLRQSQLDTLQAALDGWAAGGTGNLNITFDASVTISPSMDPEMPPTVTPNSITLNCTKDQVLAEKNHLDREIQAKSTWFYPAVGVGPSGVGTLVRRPLTTDPNEADPPLDAMDDDPIQLGTTPSSYVGTADDPRHPPPTFFARPAHMSSPAADLADLLFTVRQVRQARGASSVKVVQVGDLYELWMNREFMYADAPPVGADEIGASHVARDGFPAVSASTVIRLTKLQYDEAFQLRMGKEWPPGGATPHAASRYVFHDWDSDALYRRHNVAGAIPGPREARLQRRLAERIESVGNWSYAEPPTDPLIPALRSWMGTKPAGTFSRTNLRGGTETRWNNIVLALFDDLAAVRIHGNHDGYRSDARLLTNRGSPAASHEWFSERGVWVEHSHRWDYFNRDGVAMGAGMTNIVYYHNEELIAASGGRVASLLQQEQAFFQPGAAQWYLLVNYGGSGWFSGVQKFGVYVGGHTHGPDLVKLYFSPTNGAALVAWAEQKQREVDEAQRRARRAISAAMTAAADATTDAARRLRDGAVALRDRAVAAPGAVRSYLRDWWDHL